MIWRYRVGLALLTLMAFALRAWGLPSLGDLDFDEQASSYIGSMAPAEMLRYLLGAPFEHPPLFYLLFHGWLAAVGDSEAAMRMFSVLLGTAAVPLVGATVGVVAGPRAGLVAGAIMAAAPLHVFYSRDARMYPLLALLMALVLAVAVGLRRPRGRPFRSVGEGLVPSRQATSEPGRAAGDKPPPYRGLGPLRWWAIGALAVAALATHYYALLAVVGMAVGALVGARLAKRPSYPLPQPSPARGEGAYPPPQPSPAGGEGGVPLMPHASRLVPLVALAVAAIWIASAPGLRTSLSVVYPRAVEPTRLAGALLGSLGAPLAGPLASPEVAAGIGALTAAGVVLAGIGWRRGARAFRPVGEGLVPSRPGTAQQGPAAGDKPPPYRNDDLLGAHESSRGDGVSGGLDTGRARLLWWAAVGGFGAVAISVPALLILGRGFAPRFVVLAVPFLAILLALGTVGWPKRHLAAAGVVAGGLSVLGLAPAYVGYTRSDYGQAMAELRALAGPEDAIVLNGPWQDLLYRRYGWGLPPRYTIASTVPLEEEEAVGWLVRLAGSHPRLWVVDSATDAADPTGVVARWLDAHAYPRPVIEYEKALLRPYLTDYWGASPLQERPATGEILGIKLDTVALDRWTLEAGGEARMRIRLADPGGGDEPTHGTSSATPAGASVATQPPAPNPQPPTPSPQHPTPITHRLSVQLVGPGGQSVWHWDGPLTAVDGGWEYRAAVVVPAGSAAGEYGLTAAAYERRWDGTATPRIVRTSEVVELGRIAVLNKPRRS